MLPGKARARAAYRAEKEVGMVSRKVMITALMFAAGATVAMPAGVAYAQDGFLFKVPAFTVELRVGRLAPTTSSEIYPHLTSNFTLEKKDFRATSYSADASFRVAPSFDVVAGIGWATSRTSSESREFVDQDDQPILQETELSKLPVTVGVRYFPLSRGESIGRYAWIPAAFTPYIGAGGGMMHYRLAQNGDFVSFEDLSIFTDELESTANAVTAYGEAGASVWLSGKFGLTGSARYTLARAPMRRDFAGFEDIDLGGFQASAGLAVRF
jgi:hypothetical protein